MKPKKCALVSTPRSGTHFLRSALDNHKYIEFAGEFFKEPFCHFHKTPYSENYKKYPTTIRDYIYDDICDPSIIDLDYVGFVWHLILESDLEKNKLDKFIILERKNKLEQFVSLKIAMKTGSFGYTTTTEKVEVYPESLVSFINKHDNLYAEFRNSIKEYKDIYYEDLCANFTKTIKDIHNYLEVREDFQKWGEFCFRTQDRPFAGIPLVKQETRLMKEVIINYEDVKEYDGF